MLPRKSRSARKPIFRPNLVHLEDRVVPTVSIDLNAILGSGAVGYPSTSGTQDGRVTRDGNPSVAGVIKPYPGTLSAGSNFEFDNYSLRCALRPTPPHTFV